jgi:hypothetical protein
MITDPRFKFLDKNDVEDIIRNCDLAHIDFKDGEQVVLINTEAEYNRPMFMFDKGYFDNINEVFITSLVFALRYRDGSVNYYYNIGSIFEDIDEARKDITEVYDFLHAYLAIEENNAYGYVRIEIDGAYRTEIDLNILNSEELAAYELFSYSIIKCKVIKHVQ